MRKLLVLLVLVGSLVAGDFWVKATAERRVGAEIQDSFATGGEADVEFAGFPFTLRLLTGSIPSATLKSTALEQEGVRFTDLRMTLQDVTFSWSKVLAGEMGSVGVRDGRGRASIPAPKLVGAFTATGGDLEINLVDGKLRVRLGPVEATARLDLDGSDLVLRVPGLERRLAIELPRFVEGLQYRSVRLADSHVVVEFSLRDANFTQL